MIDLPRISGPPSPDSPWASQMLTLSNVRVYPPRRAGQVQETGIYDAEGNFVDLAATWRRTRRTTIPLSGQKPEPDKTIKGCWLWGGVLYNHFGHFLTESTTRLWAARQWRDQLNGVCFVPKTRGQTLDLKRWQRDFLDMWGLNGIQARVVRRPTIAEHMVVPGQGFGLGDISKGTAAFRAEVHAHFARDISPSGPERLFVSRAGLGVIQSGLLGEDLLEARLSLEGYAIFRPEEYDLRTQIARYKAARQIIFTDGSAIHLFGFVGRADQQVAVILRRRHWNDWMLTQIRHFCELSPKVIDALRSVWRPQDIINHRYVFFGEPDFTLMGAQLRDMGMVSGGDWADLDARRDDVFARIDNVGPLQLHVE